MTQHSALIQSDLAYLDRTTALPATALVGLRVAVLVAKWDMRRRTRKALRDLDANQLTDIGLTRYGAETEYRKRFWQA